MKINGDLPQKISGMYFYSPYSQPCSRPPPTHASAGDSWTLSGKPGSAFCGVTALFSWILEHIRFVCALHESVCPVLCKFWWLYGVVNGNLL